MRRIATTVLLVTALTLIAGCGGGDGGGGGATGGVTGTWSGSGIFHTGAAGEPMSLAFTLQLNLTGSGTLITGTYTMTRAVRGTMTGNVSGTLSGSNMSLTLGPHGSGSGTVSGNIMSLNPFYENCCAPGERFIGSITLTRA